MQDMTGLVVVVLARNEDQRLPACLNSAAFADRILVIDSGSSDNSIAVARAHGAEVFSHDDWLGFGVQRTRALQYCQDARYIFFLDADEEIPPELKQEITGIVASGEQAAWTVGWLQVAFGHTLKKMASAGGMPRLFHASCLLSFEGAVHEQAQLRSGTPLHHLQNKLLHHSYETVQDSLRKLHQYAMLGASKRAAAGRRGGVLRGLASALAGFFRFYILRRGFLHGGAGFLYCYMLAQECFFRYAALKYDRHLLNDKVTR